MAIAPQRENRYFSAGTVAVARFEEIALYF
jgi:hypothetical protein